MGSRIQGPWKKPVDGQHRTCPLKARVDQTVDRRPQEVGLRNRIPQP